MNNKNETTCSAWYLRIAPILVLLAAASAMVLLSVRTVDSPDIGYHLGYGEKLVETGWPMDTSDYIYTIEPEMELGPGEWRDETGTFRFVNVNWLSQGLFYAAWKAGGWVGLSLLTAILVAAITGLLIRFLLRCGVTPIYVAAVLLLAAVTSTSRFELRPELLTYLLLACLLNLLRPFYMDRDAHLSSKTVFGVLLLQVLLVNSHSFFLLGWILTGVLLGGAIVRWIFAAAQQQDTALARRQTAGFSGLLGGQLAVSFLNPWTWRAVVMPFEMLWFFHKNPLVSNSQPGDNVNPLSFIGELYHPFTDGVFLESPATYALLAVLILAGIGAIFAVAKGKPGLALGIIILFYITLSMRRNIAIGGLVLLPLATVAITQGIAGLRKIKFAATLTLLLGIAITASSAVLTWSTMDQSYYYNQRWATRFGLGPNRLLQPVALFETLNKLNLRGRLWCDYNDSSSLWFFVEPHPNVPIITNSWAWPHKVLHNSLLESYAPGGLERIERKYRPDWIAIRTDNFSQTIARDLAKSRYWKLFALAPRHAIFAHTGGKNRTLVNDNGLDRFSLFDNLSQTINDTDPKPAYALHTAAVSMLRLGYYSQAIIYARKALKLVDNDDVLTPHLYLAIAITHAHQGTAFVKAGRADMGLVELRLAKEHVQMALKLKPEFKEAIAFRHDIETDLTNLEKLNAENPGR